jgi:hypothetical protein
LADAQEVQGQWIVRSFVALAAAGVYRAQLYMLRDVNADSSTQYDSSGLTSEKAKHHQPKRSWYYVAALRHVLRGTRFESEIPSGNAQVRVYQFCADAASRRVYALWCPTSSQTQVNGFSFDVPNASSATLTTLEPDSTTGKQTPVAVTNGRITVNVGERPAFVAVP